MTKELTKAQLRMAALGNHMMEAGAELYSNPEVREKIKESINRADEHSDKHVKKRI
jgi:hypothetical protein